MNKPISSDQLQNQLKQGLKSLYVVMGDALLLAIEAADAIRLAARSAGYEERDTLIVDAGFKWSELPFAAQNTSLFSPRKVIDLRITTGKPGVEGAKVLQEYCETLYPDVLTLITLPRIDKTSQKSKWFTTLLEQGQLVTADDIERRELPIWIAGRLRKQGQSTSNEALEFIAERCEGNLLAAHQEIQKLALLHPEGVLSFEQIKDAVLDVARYDIYQLAEAMMLGDMVRYSRILEALLADGTANVLVLWAISEDIRALARVQLALQQGKHSQQALRDARVWGSRQATIEHAARRIKPAICELALKQIFQIDKLIKGLAQGDVLDAFLQVGLLFRR